MEIGGRALPGTFPENRAWLLKLLWLSNSEDVSDDLPEDQRAWYLAARALERYVGEPVEVITRVAWPDPKLPDLVSNWVGLFEPDIVMFWGERLLVPLPVGPIAGAAQAGVGGGGCGPGRGTHRHVAPCENAHLPCAPGRAFEDGRRRHAVPAPRIEHVVGYPAARRRTSPDSSSLRPRATRSCRVLLSRPPRTAPACWRL